MHNERHLHLVECTVLRKKFWHHILQLLNDLEFDMSDPADFDLMLVALGRIDENTAVHEEAYGIITIALL